MINKLYFTVPLVITVFIRLSALDLFWTLRVGAYSRWALIQGWVLITFSPFSASSKFILQRNNK